MKAFTILLLLTLSFSTHCQSLDIDQVRIARIALRSLEDQTVKSEFKICKNDCDIINFFDFENRLVEIDESYKTCNQVVHVYNTFSLDHPAPNSIVLYNLILDSYKEITVYLMRPYSGAVVILKYELLNNGQTKLIDTETGSF